MNKADERASRDPLHGVTLARVLEYLVERHGWAAMGEKVPVRCFLFDPSIKSSLTFLRRTPWAREKVEAWYVAEITAATPANPWAQWRAKKGPG